MALEQVLLEDRTTTVVADIDWTIFAPAFTLARLAPLFDGVPEAVAALRPAEPTAQEAGSATATSAMTVAAALAANSRRWAARSSGSKRCCAWCVPRRPACSGTPRPTASPRPCRSPNSASTP
ncbi:hypothetical protein ACFQ9X_28780 [Catenulispora yoronensis]